MSVIEVTEATFQSDVLDRSRELPVVVDFWAEWCGPCRALSPVLERLAVDANGSWVLAKIDVDANPRLAAAAQVQGIPSVRAFRDGVQVAEFTGALPEPDVRRWLEALGPTEADLAVDEGRAAEGTGDFEAAAISYRRALDLSPGHATARSLLAATELRLRSAGTDESELRRRVEADPLDVDAVQALADLEVQNGAVESAFRRLLRVVQSVSDDRRERARLHLLSLFDALPKDDARVAAARRSLSRSLF